MKPKRALVVGMGGFRGAYDSAVATELHANLSPNYFDTIYACSSGTFTASYFAADVPEIGERIWREHSYGKKIFNYRNFQNKRNILDLESLIDIFKIGDTRLPLENITPESARLVYVATNVLTGNAEYFDINQENIFDLMTASSAIPILHPPVQINGDNYLDGGLSDPLPFRRAIEEGHDEILIIYNKEPGFLVDKYFKYSKHLIAKSLNKSLRSGILNLESKYQQIEDDFRLDSRIKVIRPNIKFPLKILLDTNKERINLAADLGHKDARRFLQDNF